MCLVVEESSPKPNIDSETFKFDQYSRNFLNPKEQVRLRRYDETITLLIKGTELPKNISSAAYSLIWKGFAGNPDEYSEGMKVLVSTCNQQMYNLGILSSQLQNEM